MMSSSDINAAVCGSLGCRNTTGLLKVEVDGSGVRVLCAECRSRGSQ